MRVRVLADENLEMSAVAALQRRRPDYEVKTVSEVGLVGSADGDVSIWAREHGYIVVTHDLRFPDGGAMLADGSAAAGVIKMPHGMGVGSMIEALLGLLDRFGGDALAGRTTWLPIRKRP